jgi:hypothetical protein
MTLKIIGVKKQEAVELKKEIVSQPEIEPEAETSLEETQQEVEPVFFQALGLLKADSVIFVEKKIVIMIANREYRGWVEPRQYKELCQFLEKHEGTAYLRVYPKTFSELKKKLVIQGWQILSCKKEVPPGEKENEFVLKGVWQYVTQSQTPVMTIYRNDQAYDPTGKYLATHLPIEMVRTDCQAFEFDPNATKQAKRYFIQGLFEFDSLRDCFIWKEDIAAPTTQIPHYRKPSKFLSEKSAENSEKAATEDSKPPSPIKKALPEPQQPVEIQKASQEQGIETINIMLNGKTPELSIKFSQKPEVPSEGKTVNLQITGENDIVVKAQVARKTLAKQVEKMESFEGWVAVLSGKMVAISPDGVVEIEGAGINVFEKKVKEVEKTAE